MKRTKIKEKEAGIGPYFKKNYSLEGRGACRWWSVCSHSTSTIRVQIPLTTTIFSVKFMLERTENTQKEAGNGPFLKQLFVSC